MGELVIGTRGSQLAVRQARWVAARLAERGVRATLRVISTTGDRAGSVPLATLGQSHGIKGVFTKEIEEALLAREIDLAVHSLKDLPTELDPRLALGCVPARADPRDVLVGRTASELADGGRVGTGSLRRAAQLQALLPKVQVVGIRGNVDTRIGKLRRGDYDAIVLAAAGLQRLGRAGEVTEYLDRSRMVPAVGQGALGIEVRAGDTAVAEAAASIHDREAAAEVEAERSLLRSLGGGCDVPLGAHASARDGQLAMIAAAPSPEGSMVRARGNAPLGDAAGLGRRVAERLRRRGAAID